MSSKRIIFMLFFLMSVAAQPAFASKTTESEISAFLQELFQARANFLINQEPNTISRFYSNSIKTSRYAFHYETRRSLYINSWANERGIDLVNASDQILRTRIIVKGDVAKVTLVNSLRMDYAYPNKMLTPQWYGIGTRHSITLKKINHKWMVIKEYYSDPMEEDPKNIPAHSVDIPAVEYLPGQKNKNPRKNNITKYNRQKAIAYADKYAGAAWGAGNKNRYNPTYPDYHYDGGDCTNYASQVLGDSLEGGGLKMTNQWRANRQAGTEAWVQTDAFKRFLIYSGYGRVIATGTYREVVAPSNHYPQGAMSQLEPGDLIGYIMKKNDIDHFCVVVGRDASGYVLVNSHTGDRFHVPWDVGWDKYTKFVLIHIYD
jgi:hypothetical protein